MILLEIDISDKARCFLKYGLVSLLAIAFLSAGAVWYYQRGQAVLTVTEAQIAGQMINVRAKAAGTVTEFLPGDGDTVAAGQVIARLQVKVSAERLHELEQNLAAAKRSLEELQAGVTLTQPVYGGGDSGAAERAAEQLARMERLYEIGAVSAKERDEAAARYEAAREQGSVSYQTVTQPASPQALQVAERQVRQAEASLAAAQQEALGAEVTAPVSGTIYLSDIAAGSEVRPGQTVAYVGDGANIWLEAYVSPSHRDDLRLGQYAVYKVGDKEFSGSVVDIEAPAAAEADAAQHTEGVRPEKPHAGKYIVRISLPAERDSLLRPGSKATVRISLR